jgi:EAL domain-containing protein (putative c-di-GMP-specific phosphodiesterase class I)
VGETLVGADLAALRLLAVLPLARLVIAAELVEASLADPSARLILEALIQLAQRLGLRVLATGIERPAQRDLLQQLGCDQAEGLLFGEPLDGSGVAELVAQRNRG